MNFREIYQNRGNYYLSPSPTVRGGIVLCILIGIVTFIAGFVMGDVTRTWGAYLFNLFFFFSLALGGVLFAGMQDVIGALWGRPIKRIHESFASFLPLALVLFVVLLGCVGFHLAGAEGLYSWVKYPESIAHFQGKNIWLRPWFMVIRDIIMLGIMVYLGTWSLRKSVRRDDLLIKGSVDEARREAYASQAKLRYWSAPILVVHSLCWTFLSFDLIMSLAPTWYSTLFAGWTLSVLLQSFMATLLVAMFALSSTVIGGFYGRTSFHDVGKLLYGFTIFFAYLTYAHIITIWYGNMPEETEYFITLLNHPWVIGLYVVLILAFILPLFAFIPKASKWTRTMAIPLAACIILAQWTTDMLLVQPYATGPSGFTFPWVEIGMFLGFAGLFLASIVRFAKRHPMVAIADPLFAAGLAVAAGHKPDVEPFMFPESGY